MLGKIILHEQAEFRVTGMTPQDFVNKIVQSIPGLANDHRLFVSLRDQLPLLAEAAPGPFLDALEQLLKGNGEMIAPIFNEDKGLLTPRSHYHGLNGHWKPWLGNKHIYYALQSVLQNSL